ncbi:MAG: enhancer of mRNA decapping [Piccolia ochrophora]|nr:MAG: enhancer of mRNA decapping [Piccolia ochrophora]
MASQFIGATVDLTLRTPPNAQLRGRIAEIVDQRLLLHDVYFPQSGHRMPTYTIDGSQITDLDVAPEPATQPIPSPAVPSKQAFVDPAILSMGRRPSEASSTVHPSVHLKQPASRPPQELLTEDVRVRSTRSEVSQPANSNHGGSQRSSSRTVVGRERNDTPSATLSGPFSDLSLNGYANGRGEMEAAKSATGAVAKETAWSNRRSDQSVNDPALKKDGYTGKRSRRGGRNKAQKDTVIQMAPNDTNNVDQDELVPKTVLNASRDSLRKKPLSRNTFLEEVDPPEPTPGVIAGPVGHRAAASTKRKGRRQRNLHADDQDGWATEEATDIQGMGEFDFLGNLSKFDKRSVFDQIKAEDTTADESRLVSHNRLQPRVGTAGGKNLHFTESVLDRPNPADIWKSEADYSERSSDSEVGIGSGRSSRRAMSRQSSRQVASRKGSAVAPSSAPVTASLSRNLYSPSHAFTNSPSASPLPSASSNTPSLRLVPSNRVCPVVSPLQMLDVERIAEVEIGLTDDMMTENSARAIATVALSAINRGSHAPARGSRPPSLFTVILAGNHKSGARALAAGRHLRNHGVRVLACVLGLEREDELLDTVRRQLHVFRGMGGKVAGWAELAATLKTLEQSPDLIVDALLGVHVALEELRTDDQGTALELIRWANASKAAVLAVDIPSGIDASSGHPSHLDSAPLHILATHLVAMGAPKTGVLAALSSTIPQPASSHGQSHTHAGVGTHHAWQMHVADIGIGNSAWRKYGTRRRHGVEFGEEWVVAVRYVGGVE